MMQSSLGVWSAGESGRLAIPGYYLYWSNLTPRHVVNGLQLHGDLATPRCGSQRSRNGAATIRAWAAQVRKKSEFCKTGNDPWTESTGVCLFILLLKTSRHLEGVNYWGHRPFAGVKEEFMLEPGPIKDHVDGCLTSQGDSFDNHLSKPVALIWISLVLCSVHSSQSVGIYATV